MVYDWLAENDVDEWLPEHPVIVVSCGRIRFTAFGPAGWDFTSITRWNSYDTVTRSVPLVTRPSPAVAALLKQVRVDAAQHGRRIASDCVRHMVVRVGTGLAGWWSRRRGRRN